MRIILAIILVGYGVLLFGWMGRTPAFNASLRVEGISGSEVTANTSSMYDRRQYLFDTGYGYVFPDLVGLLTPVGLDQPELSFEQVQAQTQRGLDYLNQSAEIFPLDAHTWMAIGWGQAMQDYPTQDVLASLRRSWELAPVSRLLADRRLTLVATVMSEVPDTAVSSIDRAGIAQDIATLEKFSLSTLNSIREIAPEAASLLTLP